MTHVVEILSTNYIPAQSTTTAQPGTVKRIAVLTYGLADYQTKRQFPEGPYNQ